jgi:hypothetical protein
MGSHMILWVIGVLLLVLLGAAVFQAYSTRCRALPNKKIPFPQWVSIMM